MPIETLATGIRHFLHLESRQNVSGEITSSQENLLLRLQINEQDFDADPVSGVLKAPDDLFAQAAKEILVKAIELDPKDALPHNNLGNALRGQGKTADAIVEYKKAIELDSKHASPHYNLGVLLSGQGKADEAIAEYKKAIELDPDNASLHADLARILKKQGKTAEANAEFKKAKARSESE